MGERLDAVVSKTKVIPKALNQLGFSFNENIPF
jgi:NAD dependent epimerase/dehydratase family enzyme